MSDLGTVHNAASGFCVPGSESHALKALLLLLSSERSSYALENEACNEAA
jgi:hypothetical protein